MTEWEEWVWYVFIDSASLACKIWAWENDWEALLIYNPDHRNANAIILWRKTQSKKMMHYLNKQNFCVSYMGVGRQNKKWENDVLNRENSTTPLLKGVSTYSSIHDVHKESKSISLHFEKLWFVSTQYWSVNRLP